MTIPPSIMTAARECAEKIIDDTTDRRGWRQAWDTFDAGIKDEIRTVQTQIIADAIAAAVAAERERCAKIAEDEPRDTDNPWTWPRNIAAAIRKGTRDERSHEGGIG